MLLYASYVSHAGTYLSSQEGRLARPRLEDGEPVRTGKEAKEDETFSEA